MSLVAPNFAVLIGPCPLFGLLLAVPFAVPVVALPFVVVPVIVVPVAGCLDCFDLIVRLESTSGLAALL